MSELVEQLRLTHRHLTGVTLISVAGDLDVSTAPQLQQLIDGVRQRPDDHVVFDLAEMPFMDSSGLRILIGAYLHAKPYGSTVHLAALQALPARVVDITQIARYLRVHASVEDALDAAQAAASSRGDEHRNDPAPA